MPEPGVVEKKCYVQECDGVVLVYWDTRKVGPKSATCSNGRKVRVTREGAIGSTGPDGD